MNAIMKRGGPSHNIFGATAQRSEDCSLEDFARATRLPLNFLRQAGLTEIHLDGRRVLRVICRDEGGQTGAVAFQVTLAGERRYQWRRGNRPLPYGYDQLPEAGEQGRIVIVQHLAEALTLRGLGLPAIALLNEDDSLDDLTARLKDIPAIYLPQDRASDPALRAWIARSGLAPSVRLFDFPGGNLSIAYAAAPERFEAAFPAALERAALWENVAAMQCAAERKAAWAQCEPLARCERILDRFADELRRAGFAGETRAAKSVFLSVTSRLLDLPVSVALKGPSAGGKSYLLEKVLAYCPENAHYAVSSLSPKALPYMDEPLSHRMLVIAEQEGAQANGVEYLLRTLLSEGRIVYAVPVQSGGRRTTQQFVVEGPTGLLLTTTRLRLHPENETRMLSLEIIDTAEQTRAILRSHAERAQSGEAPAAQDYAEWHALQEWLIGGSRAVAIPYEMELVEGIANCTAVRLRRDFTRLLQMIKAHALLHQANRERDAANRIVATLEDYAAVYDLVAGPMAVALEAAVPEEVRETVEAVGRLSKGGGPIALSALARELRLDKSSVSRRVRHAVEAGYLFNMESRKGLPARLILGEELRESQETLPRPETIALALR